MKSSSQAKILQSMSDTGAVVWLTGLSGAGKSTIAAEAIKTLRSRGYRTALLDGDDLRAGLNSDLDYSAAGRKENIRRISHVAALIAGSGIHTVVCAISPFAADRAFTRAVCIKKSIAFIEVFVDTPLEVCAGRDVKGLYKKAYSGEIADFTGVSSPYEIPDDSELTIRTARCSPRRAAEMIADYCEVVRSLPGMTIRAASAARAAGRKIMQIYSSGFEVAYKRDASPLTSADSAAEQIIRRRLEKNFPAYAILSEESADDKARLKKEGCFLVDPLDGTKEFIKQNGEFTVNIAFAYRNKSIMGVVYVPASDILYYAAEGCGAFRQQSPGSRYFAREDRIQVSGNREKLTLAVSRSHADGQLAALLENNRERIGETIAAGSSLKGCLVAEGKADAYYRTGCTMEWDTAAMHCIAQQAGGVCRQGDGSPLRYNRKDPFNRKGFFILNAIENRFIGKTAGDSSR